MFYECEISRLTSVFQTHPKLNRKLSLCLLSTPNASLCMNTDDNYSSKSTSGTYTVQFPTVFKLRRVGWSTCTVYMGVHGCMGIVNR